VRERKLYVITRRDLDPSTRAVMALHVAADMGFRLAHGEYDGHQVGWREWTEHGPPIVLMTVRNRSRLERLAEKFKAHTYSDPDLNDGVCAIAIYDYHWNDDRARLAKFGEDEPLLGISDTMTVTLPPLPPGAIGWKVRG